MLWSLGSAAGTGAHGSVDAHPAKPGLPGHCFTASDLARTRS